MPREDTSHESCTLVGIVVGRGFSRIWWFGYPEPRRPASKEYRQAGRAGLRNESCPGILGRCSFHERVCASEGPMPEPLTIYFEVKKDGRMGALVSDPKTTVAKCIMKKVRNRRFPTPPSEFVVRIDLAFTR